MALLASLLVLVTSAGMLAVAQERDERRGSDLQAPPQQFAGELGVNHAECDFLGPNRDKYLQTGLLAWRRRSLTSAQTVDVVSKLGTIQVYGAAPGGSRTDTFLELEKLGTIDRYLFQAMHEAGVAPAARTNDFEFARRVTLDLTGRVPDPARLTAFVADSSADKRARLVDELMETREWVDKWTMFFGDLFKNTRRNAQVNRYPEGRNAFYKWIYSSLEANKHYDQIARELITAAGGNSFGQGALNWMVGGLVTGGPRTGQDNYDQQAVNIAETFLGLAHMDCVLCHDGRGHLDSLSVWGAQAIRYEGWEMASFLSRTVIKRHRVGDTNRRYYSVNDVASRANYPLNTQTGNRPPRERIGRVTNVEPRYPFSGGRPSSGETYRVALAREVTTDIQFARTLVNYVWKEFFVLGLLEPANQFDPARLDPDHPPPEPWGLQAYRPRLLNELAQDFVASGFDLKALMRQITNSQAYQLSSRYDGEWKPSYEPLFARKYVRRLWAEEIHDAVAQTSGLWPSYNISGLGRRVSAMRFPEPMEMPSVRNPVTAFLDTFMRGDRDEEARRGDGSALQALQLMNDPYVVNRARASGYGDGASLARRAVDMPDEEAVNTLFLTVLSRYPTPEERATSLAALQAGDREQVIEDLQWTLYNKVDFIFNY